MGFGYRVSRFLLAVVLGTTWQMAAATGQSMSTKDPYLWLEDVHGEKPLAWVKAQNARSLALLKSDPDYQKDYDTILSIMDAADRIPFGQLDHRYIFNFWQDAQHPKGLWRRTTIEDYAKPKPHWEVLLDLDRVAAQEHENWVWKGAGCAPSLSHCLVALSRGGGDAHVVREFDLNARAFMPDGFTLPEAKSNFTYIDDNTILFGNDFGPESLTASGYPRIVKLWHRGMKITAAKPVFDGKSADVAVGPIVYRGQDGATPLIERSVTFFHTEFYYVHKSGAVSKLPLPLGADVKGVTRGNLVFTLREDWSSEGRRFTKGSLLAVPVAQLLSGNSADVPSVAVLYVPATRASVEEVSPGRDAVYAAIYDNVIGSIHAFRPSATGQWVDKKLNLPGGGSTHIVSTNDWGPEAQFTFESFLIPTTLFHDDDRTAPVPIKALPARFDASGLKMDQFEAVSKDGTHVPYFVVRPKSLTSPAATVLYGYGGFELSLTPSYSANFGKLWLTKGGVFVIANIRGGGEFGPAWHDAALLTNRQKAYDDFEAVARDLIARKITTRQQLGIMGGSNGGLLVSASMVEQPHLFGAVVCQVPLTDMLRYTRIGAGASWIAEYGDPADPKMRSALLQYSPYQNVKPDVTYPPVLFVTATSDDRVTPVHARKMAALMEAEGHDVLFYENTDGGHAAAANHKQAAEMWALSFVYLKQKLGLGAPPTRSEHS
jgi:prolyl oligopeptidase